MDHPDSTFGREREDQPSVASPWYTQGPFTFARGILLRMAQKEHARTEFLAKLQKRRDATAARLALLNPNQDSDVLVEKYVFSLNPSQFAVGHTLEFGVPNGWTAFKNPLVAFRALHLFVNTPCPGLVYVSTIQAANVGAQVGAVGDGFSISKMDLNLPCLPPQNTMQVTRSPARGPRSCRRRIGSRPSSAFRGCCRRGSGTRSRSTCCAANGTC